MKEFIELGKIWRRREWGEVGRSGREGGDSKVRGGENELGMNL